VVGVKATIALQPLADRLCFPVLLNRQQLRACSKAQSYLATAQDNHLVSGNACRNG
jgi:hypothetical protein